MRKQNHSSTCDVNAWKWRVRERTLGELWPSGQQRHTSFRSEGTVQWCFLTSRITCDPPVLSLTPWVWLMPPKLGLGGTASCNCASSTVTARAEQTPGGALCTNGGGWSCDSSYAEYLGAGHVAASHQPRHTTGLPSFSAPVKAVRSSSSSSSPLQMLSGLSSRTSKGILEGIDANNLNRDLAVSGTWHQAAGVAGAEEASLISWAWRCPPGFIVRQSPLLPCLPMKAGLPAC